MKHRAGKITIESIVVLMGDGKPRSTEDICTALVGKYSSTVARAVSDLRDDKVLEPVLGSEALSPHRRKVYRLSRPKVTPKEPDNNPFLWRSFKQPEFA